MPTPEGTLDWAPLAEHLDLVAPAVAAVAARVPRARVAAIDPDLADTAAFCAAYDVALAASANCVVVAGRRGVRRRMRPSWCWPPTERMSTGWSDVISTSGRSPSRRWWRRWR